MQWMRKSRKGDLLGYLIGAGAEASVKGKEWLRTMVSRKCCETAKTLKNLDKRSQTESEVRVKACARRGDLSQYITSLRITG